MSEEKRHYHLVVYAWCELTGRNGVGQIEVSSDNRRPFNRATINETISEIIVENPSYDTVFFSNIIYLGHFTKEEFEEAGE